MRRGMQDAAGSCMQNPAHASRLSVGNRTVRLQIRRSLFASREYNRVPNDSLPPLVERNRYAVGLRHFFGFESSRRALFTNLALVWAATIGLYWLRPFPNFLRTIYINNAMTTAALVFAFLLADVIGPGLLISSVCLLSRIRPSVLFLRRKVRTFRRSGRKKAGAR